MSTPTNTATIPDGPAPARRHGPRRGPAALLGWLGRTVPVVLVLTLLGGLAAWGHHTHWKVPKFSELTGRSRPAAEDWCDAHGVPESVCVECQPDLMPRVKVAYCQRHDVPECPLDHPEIAQVSGKPRLPRYDTLAALALRDRPANNSKCKLHERRIQFASAAAADKAGVDIDLVRERPMEEAVAANGEVGYDQTRVARLSSRVPGTVWRVDRQVGDPVRRGDVLALVDAAEVGKAKAEFLQALAQHRLKAATVDRLRPLEQSGAVNEYRLREAESAAGEARIRLQAAQQALANLGLPLAEDDVRGLADDAVAARVRFLGLPADVAAGLDARRATANLLPVTAPLDGVVVERTVVAGEVVDAARPLFVVADTRRVWLTLHVRQEDAPHLALGQPVRFRPAGAAAEVAGTLDWLSTAVDERTRTLPVRATLANPDGGLRAGAFGAGRIILRAEPYAVVVPREAVHWDGDCWVVFVRDKDYLKESAPKVFHVRKVRPGAQDQEYVEILAGVLPDEVVAIKGGAVLQAELLKANLGES